MKSGNMAQLIDIKKIESMLSFPKPGCAIQDFWINGW
jgi:hypothetical protein